MNIRRFLKIIGIPVVILTPLAFVCGQAPAKAPPPNSDKPCHENTHLCSTRIKKDFAALESYVRHLKPGSPVTFNPFDPKPDRSGDPIFEYGGMSPYQRLQYDLYDLSKYPPGPCRDGACRGALEGANSAFGLLGNTSDRRSADSATADLKPAIDKLARSLASMRQGK